MEGYGEEKKIRARGGQKQRRDKDQAMENNRAALILPVMCMIDQTYTSAAEVGRRGFT